MGHWVRRQAFTGIRARKVILTVTDSVIGLAAGACAFTCGYAKGYSHLTDNPAACVHCHVMQEQYDGWINSSHRSVATGNDFHTLHGVVPKYRTKVQNGFWHPFTSPR